MVELKACNWNRTLCRSILISQVKHHGFFGLLWIIANKMNLVFTRVVIQLIIKRTIEDPIA